MVTLNTYLVLNKIQDTRHVKQSNKKSCKFHFNFFFVHILFHLVFNVSLANKKKVIIYIYNPILTKQKLCIICIY